MTKKLYIAAIALGLLSIAPITNAVQTSTRTEQETVEISLDTNSENPVEKIDLSKYNMPMPDDCAKANVSCKESTNVEMVITKTWEITTVYELTDPRLAADEYSLYYPDIITETPVNRNSSPEQVMLLQRALYERGLLNVLPTGRYGALTELAVMHFNQIKNIDNCSQETISANTDTIEHINAMKQRMANPNYLPTTNPPAFNSSNLCPKASKRFNDLVTFVNAAQRGEIVQVLSNVNNTAVSITIDGSSPNRKSLNLDGFVKIEQ